jgi:tetratricopeptide (TPR) repeat protein
MATDPARSNPSPARHLWQVPAFLLGVAAVVAVLYVVRPPTSADGPAGAEHQLREGRKALEQLPPDLNTALQRADAVLAAADRYPQLAGEAHFLAGTAHLRLADEPGADVARERQQAKHHLEQAVSHGVGESDRPKLDYRLAKVSLLLGGDPGKAIALLAKSAEADDPMEGYGLLAAAYTRLTPPDLNKASEAARQQLERALRTNDLRSQAVARYHLGKLDLQLKKDKDARAMLTKVGLPEAPPEQYYDARKLLAESYEETQEWDAAARNWDKARENPKLAPPERARMLYHLGRCYAQQQRKEAVAVYEEAVALGGPEGQAAGIRLAELSMESDPAAAATALATALQSVHAPDDYRNPLVPVEEVRTIIERLSQLARDKADGDLARKAVEAYAVVALPGRDDELAGQVFEAQGKALAEQVKSDPSKEESAREANRQAAAAYERAAGKAPAGPEQAARLWQAAQLSLRAGQTPRALELLTRVAQQDGALAPEKMAEAWLLIGTTHHTSQQFAEARAAYQKCLALPGPFALKAQLGLARIDLAEKHFDEAERSLQDVLKKLREAPQPDADLQEQTLFALAETAYQRQGTIKEDLREYGTAEQRLRGAIEQYPDSEWAISHRVMLGLCYWNDARLKSRPLEDSQEAGRSLLNEDEKKTYQRQRNELIRMSAEQYDKAEELLLARQRANGRLTPDEAKLLKQASYWGSDCYFWLQQYDEAVRRYQLLAARYPHLPEELIALSQLWQCYASLRQTEKAAEVTVRMKDALPNIPDSAFDGRLYYHRRDYWTNWLQEVTKPAIPPVSAQPAARK